MLDMALKTPLYYFQTSMLFICPKKFALIYFLNIAVFVVPRFTKD